MGYDTDFQGAFAFDKPLAPAHLAYLQAFSNKRHMVRSIERLLTEPDPVRLAVGLPLGKEGEYFIGNPAFDHTEERHPSVLGPNTPPAMQPGLWCQWVPTHDGRFFIWNGTEKFYHYIEWLQYLIDAFFKRWHYTIHGGVLWQAKDNEEDRGTMVVSHNIISIHR